MSLKRHWQRCNTIKSGRRWRGRPYKWMRERGYDRAKAKREVRREP